MGAVIRLADHRLRRRGAAGSAAFCFDLADAGTYLAAERVDRHFGGHVEWVPARHPRLGGSATAGPEAAARRAAELRLPLVWPDGHPAPVPRAMRAAARAAEEGRGGAFVLAATRLAFCGGYDLEDPEVLAEAAAAAGLGLDACLAAAADPRRDPPIDAAGRWLVARGARRLPALRAGRLLVCGEERLGEALAASRAHRAPRRRAMRR